MTHTTRKILIIDDDSRNIFALRAVLKAKNYTCVSADSAEKGFRLIEDDPDIALVLMDIMMPDMDGYQAIAALKTRHGLRNIPVIAVTAQAMPGDKERCLDAGAVGYIPKPIRVNELIEQINKHL